MWQAECAILGLVRKCSQDGVCGRYGLTSPASTTRWPQHPKQFRYNMEHYMCDLCQQELREQAAHVASRSEQASPRNGLGLPGRKSGLQSAFAAEVRMCPSSKSGHQVFLIASLSLIMLCAHCLNASLSPSYRFDHTSSASYNCIYGICCTSLQSTCKGN